MHIGRMGVKTDPAISVKYLLQDICVEVYHLVTSLLEFGSARSHSCNDRVCTCEVLVILKVAYFERTRGGLELGVEFEVKLLERGAEVFRGEVLAKQYFLKFH